MKMVNLDTLLPYFGNYDIVQKSRPLKVIRSNANDITVELTGGSGLAFKLRFDEDHYFTDGDIVTIDEAGEVVADKTHTSIPDSTQQSLGRGCSSWDDIVS